MSRLRREAPRLLLGGLACLALGLLLGGVTKPGVNYNKSRANKGLPPLSNAGALERVSNLVGWSYFVMWSVSFWPQVLINFRLKSVAGLSFDFVGLNLVGFSCYSVYNCALFFSPSVQRKYEARHGTTGVPVQANDVFFGLHAVAVTLLTVCQMLVFRDAAHSVSRPVRLFVAALLATATVSGIVSAAGGLDVLDWLLTLSYLKLSISLTKYFPQAFLNFRRKSTAGWSIENVLLDFFGGLLSVLQLVLDCSESEDWSGVSGNLVKFALGFTSMVFDVVFLTQHYLLYPHATDGSGAAGDEGVLALLIEEAAAEAGGEGWEGGAGAEAKK